MTQPAPPSPALPPALPPTLPQPPQLNTERPSADHPALDQYDSATLVAALAGDQQQALAAVLAAAPQIAAAVDAALPRLRAGGRLIYVGGAEPHLLVAA